jgi:hypothetical protein
MQHGFVHGHCRLSGIISDVGNPSEADIFGYLLELF